MANRNRASVSQTTIAKRLGVSQRAVSFALNGKPGVAEKTRRKILEVAREVGYRPNAAARVMRQGRFGSIGILASSNPGVSMLQGSALFAIQEALKKQDMNLLMAHVPDDKIADPEALPRVVREWCVDGLLVNITGRISESMTAAVERSGVPAVWLNVKRDHDSVYPDDFNSAKEMTEQLILMGHKHIVHVTKKDVGNHWHYSVWERMRGYEAAMQAAGLTPRVEKIAPPLTGITPSMRAKELYVKGLGLLKEKNPPTAIFAYAGNYALPFIEAARHLGRSIPGKLSVVGYGDKELEYIKAIATITLPFYTMGTRAVEMLLQKINKPDRPRASQAIPGNVIWGETLGPLEDGLEASE